MDDLVIIEDTDTADVLTDNDDSTEPLECAWCNTEAGRRPGQRLTRDLR